MSCAAVIGGVGFWPGTLPARVSSGTRWGLGKIFSAWDRRLMGVPAMGRVRRCVMSMVTTVAIWQLTEHTGAGEMPQLGRSLCGLACEWVALSVSVSGLTSVAPRQGRAHGCDGVRARACKDYSRTQQGNVGRHGFVCVRCGGGSTEMGRWTQKAPSPRSMPDTHSASSCTFHLAHQTNV